jgi:hypothetical protein
MKENSVTVSEIKPTQPVRLLVLLGMIVLAILCRLLPHPQNFTPIGAMALFGGASISDRRLSVFFPLLTLVISDLFIAFHDLTPIVYLSFGINWLLGRWLRHHRNVLSITAMTFLGAIQFFLLTNFACWIAFFPKTLQGLVDCYLLAIPHFQNTLLGDLFFVTLLFGSLAFVENCFPQLQERTEVPVHA